MIHTWRPSLPARIVAVFVVLPAAGFCFHAAYWHVSADPNLFRQIELLVLGFGYTLWAISSMRRLVTLTDEEVIVQNLFRRHRLPLGEVVEATAGDLGLRLSVTNGRTVSPGAAGPPIWRRARRHRRNDEIAKIINDRLNRHRRLHSRT
ncbi:hypothetical protein [Catellatospora vulcania]|uniref:hypothetical protein n=1 Tax=Catellatospora vulcania TaxID=1460450 RepID=UPI0012D3C3B7|nr:hypothetical protein [Catellatospora vulcania]